MSIGADLRRLILWMLPNWALRWKLRRHVASIAYCYRIGSMLETRHADLENHWQMRCLILKHMLRYKHPHDASDLLSEIPLDERPEYSETNRTNLDRFFDSFAYMVSIGMIDDERSTDPIYGYRLSDVGRMVAARLYP